MAIPTKESSSGPVNMNFGEHEDAVVDQLWTLVGPIINSLMKKMEHLLTRFVVKAADRSLFLRHFESPSDLLAVYWSLVSRYLEGGIAYDDANDKEEGVE